MKKLLRLKLQLFAEDEPTVEPNVDGGDNANATGGTDVEMKTFDEILSNKEYQSEFDKRVSKALETAKTKWEKETQNKLKEAEKLAKMNAKEKEEHERQKRVAELEKREQELTKKELIISAKEILSDKNLPLTLVDVLDYTDAEKCKESIDSLEKAFNEEVEARVLERLKGKSPTAGSSATDVDPFTAGFDSI